jgi:hypothetical protein
LSSAACAARGAAAHAASARSARRRAAFIAGFRARTEAELGLRARTTFLGQAQSAPPAAAARRHLPCAPMGGARRVTRADRREMGRERDEGTRVEGRPRRHCGRQRAMRRERAARAARLAVTHSRALRRRRTTGLSPRRP